MKVNRRGVTRIVFIFKNVVVKIPNFTYSWKHFLIGITNNIQEKEMWRAMVCVGNEFKTPPSKYFGNYILMSDLLCPVRWASWGGWILIMEKADVEKHIEEVRSLNPGCPYFSYSDWKNNGLDGDDKPDNFGYYKNRLVKIDYQ